MKRLALIPARGGLKGLSAKNLAVVGGLTLLARAVQCALDAGVFESVVVGTGDPTIAEEGIKAGAQALFLRPKDLADAALTVSVVPNRFHPLKQLILDEKGRAKHYLPEGLEVVYRQEVRPTYIRNGICYVVERRSRLALASLAHLQ